MTFGIKLNVAWLILVVIFLASGCRSGTVSFELSGMSRREIDAPTSEFETQNIPLDTSIPLHTTSDLPETSASETTKITISETTPKTISETTTIASIEGNPEIIYSNTCKRDVLVLMVAYPEYIIGVESEVGNIYLRMKSGDKLLYDDKKKKSFDEKIDHADIQDMLEQIYPLDDIKELMDTNDDPGRFRVYSLLNELFGASKPEVLTNLTTVSFGDQELPFNKNAGGAAAFQAVSGQLDALVERQPLTAVYIYPSSGTFNYRTISGTDRLSPHAFGIAIDLKSHENDYWLWADSSDGAARLREYPNELVSIFEDNGFIWGGKWNYFDLLHYEYRPEIILKAKYFPEEPELEKPWYEGADLNNGQVKNCIELIDRNLP